MPSQTNDVQFEKIVIIHITHIDNLASIVSDNALYSDAKSIERGACEQQIGMSRIKKRRLEELKVTCHPNTMVGEYVPFYFWHHSPMLYLIHKGNIDLSYTGGQESIIHLVSRMKTGIEWADANNKKWAFTSSNAGAYICNFYDSLDDLDEVNWASVKEQYWKDCKEEKQAEFLIQEYYPFSCFSHIVAYNDKTKQVVEETLKNSDYSPKVLKEPSWYY